MMEDMCEDSGCKLVVVGYWTIKRKSVLVVDVVDES